MIKQSILDGIKRYVEQGVPVGDFLRCVLSNDLKGAFAHADDENREALAEIVKYCYCEIPGGCWGSVEKYFAWINRKSEERKNHDHEDAVMDFRAAVQEYKEAKGRI